MKMQLWGKTFEVETNILAIRQLSIELKKRVEADTYTIISNRTNGVPAKVDTVNGRQCMSIVPYAWDNIIFIEENVMGKIGSFINSVFKDYGVSISPNWTIINQQWLDELNKIEKAFGELTGQATQAALNNQVLKYHQVYNEELSKDYGLSFGILSSSLTAHLVYAAQAAAKEQKDHARAEKAAIESLKSSHDEITVAIFESMYPVYINQIEPALINLLGRYYAYVASLLSKELGYSYDDICSIEDLSKDTTASLNDVSIDNKEKILNILSVDICSADAVMFALKNNMIDDEFVFFFSNAPKILKNNSEAAILNFLREQKKNASIFNRDSLTNDVVSFVKNVRLLYSTCTDSYENIINEIYKVEIDKVCSKFDEVIRLSKNPESLAAYARTKKSIEITRFDIENFIKYNEIFATERMNKVFSLIGGTDVALFERYISDLSEKINAAYEKYQEAERQRRLREEQLARERREREERHRQEVEAQKRSITEEIQTLSKELNEIGFALFGQKAHRKAELKEQIARKQTELNNIK